MSPRQYKNLRKKLGMSQQELANEVGVSERQIRRREKGDTEISVEAELAIKSL